MRRRSFLKNSAMLTLATTLSSVAGAPGAQKALAASVDGQRAPRTIRDLEEFEKARNDLGNAVIKGVDLRHLDAEFWGNSNVQGAQFLGCGFRETAIEQQLQERGATLFPGFDGLAYDPYRATLYSPGELVAQSESGAAVDALIYDRYIAQGKFTPDLLESLARRIHDYSMDDGLDRLTAEIPETDMVCITGGFFQDRTDPWFRKTAIMARLLSLSGKFIVTGGGPGIMEAANLGAYLSAYDESALDEALKMLAKAPKWADEAWSERALEVLDAFPEGTRSLGIPTWFYGFEPTNLFATDIAKYFDNDIREGVLMSIAKGGAVFAPGAAGARQEIFMVATQNHFGSTGYFYPMVLFGTEHYQVETHVYQLLRQVANDNYRELVHSTDDAADVVRFIEQHPPRKSENHH